MGIGRANLIAVILDLVESTILMIAYAVASLLAAMKSMRLAKLLCYFRILLPRGLLSSGLRVAIDFRMGHLDRAIATIEGIIGAIEESLVEETVTPRVTALVLADLYAHLARAHLVRGQVDDAALAVIRASRGIGVERLSGLPDFDAKTAQIVKAAVAAGRMLEQNGSAQVLIDQGTGHSRRLQLTAPKRARFPVLRKKSTISGDHAKVIPFPRPS